MKSNELDIGINEQNEIIEKDEILQDSKEENDMSKSKENIITKIVENLPDSEEFYSKIEKDQKGRLNPRIAGIFIIFDNIEFYLQQFQKFQFFSNYGTSLPTFDNIDWRKIAEDIENYIKEQTNIELLLNSHKINFNDIIADYILYFIDKKDKLTKDSCDIKHIYKILSNLIEIPKKEESISYREFIEFIVLFNFLSSYITYPLSAIKFLNDEKIIKDIYIKILKEMAQYEKEENFFLIIIESFFHLLIQEILSDSRLIPKLNYIHLFLMNIVNSLNLPSKNFYTYMQFKSLYKFIENNGKSGNLNKIYSEIYKLKDVFIDPNKKEEILKSYLDFYQKIRSDYKISNYIALRIFIIDFFTYELKKYQENEILFPIIMDVLTENNGDAFLESNKIFNIFLKKYLFDEPPKNEEECLNILENAYQIKKGNKYEKNEEKNDVNNVFINFEANEINIKNKDNSEIKIPVDDEVNNENEIQDYNEISDENEIQDHDEVNNENEIQDYNEVNNEKKIQDYNEINDVKEEKEIQDNVDDENENNNVNEIQIDDLKETISKEIIEPIKEEEIKEIKQEVEEKIQPIKDNDIKEDLFLKKYNDIINTKGNEKIKIIIDEIIQQVFGFYFNGYFMSYLDEINNTNSYGSSFPASKIFETNKLFLKTCIEFLEKIEKPFKGKEISIFLANAFIQSFLYVFIKYFYKNINEEKKYDNSYNIGNIFNIIAGKSKFRRVVQIYVFRLINNFLNDKTFKKFKNFDVKNEEYRTFVKDFLQEYSFEDPPFKLIFYCKKIFEDFFNDDTQCLPINYKLKGYEFENDFPYDNNIINIKMINNKELSTNSINCY